MRSRSWRESFAGAMACLNMKRGTSIVQRKLKRNLDNCGDSTWSGIHCGELECRTVFGRRNRRRRPLDPRDLVRIVNRAFFLTNRLPVNRFSVLEAAHEKAFNTAGSSFSGPACICAKWRGETAGIHSSGGKPGCGKYSSDPCCHCREGKPVW